MKYIQAIEMPVEPSRRTKLWRIETKPKAGPTDPDWVSDGVDVLGVVKWHPGWRRYAFFPLPNKLFEHDCLRDLADFCEENTKLRKAERIAEREAEKAGAAVLATTAATTVVP